MDIDERPVDIPRLPEVPFMVEPHFFKATSGRDIASLDDGIDSMQVIDGECQGG